MSIEEGYHYQQPLAEALSHVRRYPAHYTAIALFTLLLLLVPRIDGRPPAAPPGTVSGTPQSAPAVPAATSSTSAAAAAPESTLGRLGITTTAAPALPPTTGAARRVAGIEITPSVPDTEAASPGPAPAPPPAPSDDDGPDQAAPGGVDLPSLPPVPVPQAPEELQPVLAAVAPLTTNGCSAVGLAAVVVAVAAPAAEGVPVAELMPYLAPVYSACATFPAAQGAPTICAPDEAMRDAGYPADVEGLTRTPNVIGLGVDVLAGWDRAIEAYTGTNPGIAEMLAEPLGCHPDEA